MRTLLLCCLIASSAFSVEGTAAVTMDDLYGRWVPDLKKVDWAAVVSDWATKNDQEKAEVKKAKEEEWKDLALTLTPRLGRLVINEEDMKAGLWRVDDAKPKAGTIVIQSKGGIENRYAFTFDGKDLNLDGLPAKIPLMKEASK